jgi:hypothetical protein
VRAALVSLIEVTEGSPEGTAAKGAAVPRAAAGRGGGGGGGGSEKEQAAGDRRSSEQVEGEQCRRSQGREQQMDRSEVEKKEQQRVAVRDAAAIVGDMGALASSGAGDIDLRNGRAADPESREQSHQDDEKQEGGSSNEKNDEGIEEARQGRLLADEAVALAEKQEALDAMEEIEDIFNSISREAFASFAKYVTERI